MPDIVIKGLAELARTLERELPEKLAKGIIRDALRAGAEVIAGAIEDSAPVKSGELQESIVSRITVETRRGLHGFGIIGPGYDVSRARISKRTGKPDTAGTPGVYAVFVEKGHGPPGTAKAKRMAKRRSISIEFGDRATPPHPFMGPAFAAAREEALDAIIASLRAGIEEAAKSVKKT